jgi:hypothetical protein
MGEGDINDLVMECKKNPGVAILCSCTGGREKLVVRHKALDHFIVLGETHLRHILACYVAWYNACRPHQSLNNEPLGGLPPTEQSLVLSLADIMCEEKLGGLLKHYSRRAV